MTVSEEVKLQKSENAWKPGVKREVASDVPETLQTHVGYTLHHDTTHDTCTSSLHLYAQFTTPVRTVRYTARLGNVCSTKRVLVKQAVNNNNRNIVIVSLASSVHSR